MNERIESRFASRKFILVCALVLIATGFRIAGLLDSAEWINVATWLAGLYMAGNVGAAVAGKAKN